jgi:signal peptidase I
LPTIVRAFRSGRGRKAIGACLLGVLVVIGVVSARRRLVAVTVEGASMQPSLYDGDRVLVLRTRLPRIRTGDVVVVERPHPYTKWEHLPPLDGKLTGRHWFVKRTAAVPGQLVPATIAATVGADRSTVVPAGMFLVLGDGASSSDSRRWGYFPQDRLLGVVIARLPQRS